jgi:5-methylcytosine-specific restriction endonuclease McrA
MNEVKTASSEGAVEGVRHAVLSVIDGDVRGGRRALEERVDRTGLAALASEVQVPVRRAPLTLAVSRSSRRVTVGSWEKFEVFAEDGYRCRYCGTRTVHPDVLTVLGSVFPDLVGVHPHWTPKDLHILQWTISTSLDHMVPVAAGGGSGRANLAVACSSCQYRKGRRLIEDLGWALRDRVVDGWDGLVGDLPSLRSAVAELRTA